MLYNKQLNYFVLQPFSCMCFPFLRPYNRHKFDFHSAKYVFLGCSHTQAGYKCLHPSGRVYVSQHVQFNPSDFPYPSLFPTSSVPKSSVPQGYSTTFLEPIFIHSTSSWCPSVAPVPVPTQSGGQSNFSASFAEHLQDLQSNPASSLVFVPRTTPGSAS